MTSGWPAPCALTRHHAFHGLKTVMRAYLRTALIACRAVGMGPCFLLHPLDRIGGDQMSEPAFSPGMDLPSARKVEPFAPVLKTLRGCQVEGT